MSLAPVVIFTFNRLEHTKRTIDALKKNKLAEETEVFIFSDGPRNFEESEKVKNVRKYIRTINGFKKVNIYEAENNNGLAKSVIEGVSKIINKYEKVIVLEDDLITSKYFLKYMNEGLEVYKKRNDIWSLSGYSPNIEIPNGYREDIYITRRGSSWGWATWKDRWNKVDWDMKEYSSFKKNKDDIKKFNESGKDLGFMLGDQMKGRIDSWAVRWVYNQFKNNMLTIYPTKSLVKNIGNDLSGTHSRITTIFDVELVEKEIKFNLNIIENKEILIAFKKLYDKNFSGYFALIIKKIGLYRCARRIRNKFLLVKSKVV